MGAERDAQVLRNLFLRDLKRVAGLLARLPADVRPSLRNLARAADVSHQAVDTWLKGQAVPADAEALRVVLATIHAAASSAGLSARELQFVETPPGGNATGRFSPVSSTRRGWCSGARRHLLAWK
ncbi:hypothetical protein [Streptacidiphilus sp. PAMC 29251]